MVEIKNMLDEAESKLKNNTASSTDWQLVYYECYIDQIDEETKNFLSELLLKATVEDEKIDILKSVIKENLGVSRIMK